MGYYIRVYKYACRLWVQRNLDVLNNMIEFGEYRTSSAGSLQLIVLNAKEPAYKYVVDLSKD